MPAHSCLLPPDTAPDAFYIRGETSSLSLEFQQERLWGVMIILDALCHVNSSSALVARLQKLSVGAERISGPGCRTEGPAGSEPRAAGQRKASSSRGRGCSKTGLQGGSASPLLIPIGLVRPTGHPWPGGADPEGLGHTSPLVSAPRPAGPRWWRPE